VVVISGEAGAGKSRLLFEFRQRIKAERCRVLHVSCPSSGHERPYAPFIDLLYAGLSLDAEGGGDALVERVIANAIAIDPELERYLAHYLDLLSLRDGRYSLPPNFEGDEKRRAFEEALARFFTLASRQKPIVLILEDWHWSDEASDSALSYLVERIDACGVYVLVNHRPEYEARWAKEGSHTALSLGPLEPHDTEAMMARSLGASALPPGLVELVESRANGNPLFIEELCHSLVEEEIVRVEEGGATLTRPIEELELPDTVQAVIRERLDRLGEATTEPLHLAAVIGREFSARLLARVHSNALGLDETLAVLVASGVILPLDERVELEYAFKHVLVQAVVYETLLLQQRRDLHARVGAAMEELYANRLPNYYESLARHFDLGQVWDRAVDYTVKAGVKAVQHHAIGSALSQFDRARQILSEHGPDVSWRVRYDLCFHRAVALGDQGQWPLALTELVEAKNLAEHASDVGLRIQAQVAQANAAFWAHEFDDSLAITAELEAQLSSSPDVQLRITSLQAMANFMLERLPTALEKEEEARGLLRDHPDSPNRSYAAFVLGVFSRWRGDSAAAAEILLSATQLDKQHASAGVYLQSLMHYCLAIGERGQYQVAIDLLLEGREYGLAADSLYGVLKITNTLGWAYSEICNAEKAHEYNQLALEAIEETKGSNTSTLSEVASFTRLNVADLYLTSGEFTRAREQLEIVASTLGNADFFLARTRWKPRCLIGLGELWLGLGEVETAQAYLAQLDASETADRFPFTKHQVRAARLRAALLSAQGRAEAAKQTLEEALGRAHRLGNPPELWKVQLALGDLLAEMGEAERASSCHREACDVVESVVGSLSDPTLKSGFLSAPPIRKVLSRARS
jgi:tetratricopeptide (TPR) repeat protein